MASSSPDADEFGTALKAARAAIDMLGEHRIPPTPPRFMVAYTHIVDHLANLSQAINRLVARDRLTPDAMDELYRQFFGHAVDEADLKNASLRFARTVGQVSECIGTAKDKALAFGQVLDDFRDQAETSGTLVPPGLDRVISESLAMAEANRQLSEKLSQSAHEITALNEHLDRLEREALLDSLTGIPNRKAFDAALRKALSEAVRVGSPLSLLMIDIDLFKNFNDLHGHVLGDQVLKLVARTMSECLRIDDIPARYGGEEFSVILPGLALTEASGVAEAIRRTVAAKKIVNRRTGVSLGTITLSVGIAQHRPGESGSDIVHRADEALYMAKQLGRNRVMTETALQL